jgi:hypothetical protein
MLSLFVKGCEAAYFLCRSKGGAGAQLGHLQLLRTGQGHCPQSFIVKDSVTAIHALVKESAQENSSLRDDDEAVGPFSWIFT